jgi:Mrp family chromosome partitioning ATPase
MIASLREQYDIVFFDCPPVEIVADTTIIARWADTTLFVIRAGLMERDMLPVMAEYYEDKKFSQMLILLNGTIAAGSSYSVHRNSFQYGYKGGYGYYGYGYGYGKKGES